MKIILFLSAKGGVGKTSTALSIAKVLSQLGNKVLFLDADLGTNGGSCFFELPDDVIGLYELASRPRLNSTAIITLQDKERIVSNAKDPQGIFYGFHIIASNLKFRETYQKPKLENFNPLMDSINNYASTQHYDFLLVDCQSGYNDYTREIFKFFDLKAQPSDLTAIIIVEQDRISNRATEFLKIKLGSDLLNIRPKYLVSKLYLQEMGSYFELQHFMANFDQLPAIPFDFEVRKAFALGVIPLDIKNPTAYLFAITRILRSLYPHLGNRIDQLNKDILKPQLEQMELQQKRLESEIIDIENGITSLPWQILLRAASLPMLFAFLTSLILILLPASALPDPTLWIVSVSILLSIGFLIVYRIYMRVLRNAKTELQDLEMKRNELTAIIGLTAKYRALEDSKSGDTSLSIQLCKKTF